MASLGQGEQRARVLELPWAQTWNGRTWKTHVGLTGHCIWTWGQSAHALPASGQAWEPVQPWVRTGPARTELSSPVSQQLRNKAVACSVSCDYGIYFLKLLDFIEHQITHCFEITERFTPLKLGSLPHAKALGLIRRPLSSLSPGIGLLWPHPETDHSKVKAIPLNITVLFFYYGYYH